MSTTKLDNKSEAAPWASLHFSVSHNFSSNIMKVKQLPELAFTLLYQNKLSSKRRQVLGFETCTQWGVLALPRIICIHEHASRQAKMYLSQNVIGMLCLSHSLYISASISLSVSRFISLCLYIRHRASGTSGVIARRFSTCVTIEVFQGTTQVRGMILIFWDWFFKTTWYRKYWGFVTKVG